MDLGTIALIVTSILTVLGALGYGTKIAKIKDFIAQVKNFFVVLTDALNDNNISKDELKTIIEEAMKIFTFWKAGEKEAVSAALKGNKKLTF